MDIIKRPAMWMLPRRPKRVSFLNLAIFTALVCSLYIFRLPHLPLVHQDVEVDEFQGSDPPPRMVEFWKDLAEALSRAEPNATQIRAKHDLPRIDFDPFGGAPKLGIDQIKKIPAGQLESLKQTHEDFIESIRRLAPNMPFKPGSRGIVMTADSAYLGVAITSLLMLRRAGSKLPVELFLDSTNDHTRQVCDQTLSALNAKCFNMDDFFRLPDNSTTLPKLEKYQFKVFALLFSSFQDIMFLDADAFPIHNPDHLLQVEPFKSHGLVTWPDFWLPTVSPLFYYIVGAAPPQVTLESRSTESGIMLYNKEKHADSLLLATYYNLYGPKLYYPLHSQSAWGQGDKETFRLSAMVLDKPIWHVQIPPEMMTDEHINEGSGIRQVDPEQDWQAQLQAQELAAKLQNGDLSGLEEEEKVKPPRWMFAHTNRVKIDARRLSETVGKIIYKKEEDKYQRLWGSDSSTLIDEAGYDLEKAIWEEIIKADCERSFLEECEKIREYYESVFVS